MLGLFTKKEPVKTFGNWSEFRQCIDCDRLQKPFCGDFTGEVCPECGSRNNKVVVARWEEYVKSGGLMCEVVLTRHEIKT